MLKESFVFLYSRIQDHPIFHNNSYCPQLRLEHQLVLALERLGSNGNGASVGRFRRNLKVARGTVIKCTRRVITAILSLRKEYLQWPTAERRKEISAVMKL